MNKTKIVLMTTLLGSVLGLAACQVTPSEQAMNHDPIVTGKQIGRAHV